jgi:hypothetical protein
MDVIKIDFKETICENVQLLDWLMNRVMGRALAKRTINVTVTKNLRKFLTGPTIPKSRRTLIHQTSLHIMLSWSQSGDGESGNAHTRQHMVVDVIMINCGPSCFVIVGNKEDD